jgi:threonine dehydrogenase-like Zn-dependent dehydrogenase
MKALVVRPGEPGSARLVERPEPSPDQGTILLAPELVGVCGTDREIVSGEHGEAPGSGELVLGHEALCRVIEAPASSDLLPGDRVVPMVRHPDPEPCASCAAGEWDMCLNGRYREHGIRGVDGFLVERLRLEPARLIKVPEKLGWLGVLVEPASVVAKAWEHIDHIVRRGAARPRRALVTGAGPVGLLAALLARQRGLELAMLDRTEEGPKPELARALGAAYASSGTAKLAAEADVIIECTGAGEVVLDVIRAAPPGAIICLAGLASSGRKRPVDVAALNRELVLESSVVFGTVNANRRHHAAAVQALAAADREWLARLVTRREPLARFAAALEHRPGEVKVVIEVG